MRSFNASKVVSSILRTRAVSCFQGAGHRTVGVAHHRALPCFQLATTKIGLLACRQPSQSLALAASATVEVFEKAPEVTAPMTKYRKDYAPPSYLIDQVDLKFVLKEDVTDVVSKLEVKANYAGSDPPPLFLDGDKDVSLVSVTVNGSLLPASGYTRSEKGLTISQLPPGDFELCCTVQLKPQDNTSLEGLYKSGGNWCTQCEAEGFRRITFFLDRPDVMSRYTTRIEADKELYPVLLSNGNLTFSGDLEGGRHFAVWEDPFPKPCYLFALVAGPLCVYADKFDTMSGRQVALRIYSRAKDLDKVAFAMEALKKAMKWDEEKYGLEYDLDLFNIVAIDDFNMGAMENKSLNIFNNRLVLANPDTATDVDFARIEGVVAHEYFHNWTGNRVTCRDWFQLTLKEGLTVFRDQEFSADMNSRAVQRMNDVVMLRAAQFAEDSGPMAHPVRPDSYIKMDNFYTVTVYEKGAEVVRMYNTLLGQDGFRRGMDLYFKRHDGHAVTCDDFMAAMADANDTDLSGLKPWYYQAGTPVLTVSTHYNPAAHTFSITALQYTPATPGQDVKEPVLIPLALALLGPDGKEMPLKLQGVDETLGTSTVLRVDQAEQTFVFENVEAKPIPSLLRGFSAPVKLVLEGQTQEELLFLMANDTDPVNRWEAGQQLSKKLLSNLYQAAGDEGLGGSVAERCLAAGGVPPEYVAAVEAILRDDALDGSFKAMAVSLPAPSEMVVLIHEVDPKRLHAVRQYVHAQLAHQLRPLLEELVAANDSPAGEAYQFNASACARRAIKNKALGLLSFLEDPAITQQLLKRFREASNMTDRMAALAALNDSPGEERDIALSEFYERYKEEPLVVLKWLALVAGADLPDNLRKVEQLLEHPAFNISNPNNCYSTFLAFARSPRNFHAEDGSGYSFLADAVLKVDSMNPQVAARLVSPFTQWRQYDPPRQALMKQQLKRIISAEGLSENVFELAAKSSEE